MWHRDCAETVATLPRDMIKMRLCLSYKAERENALNASHAVPAGIAARRDISKTNVPNLRRCRIKVPLKTAVAWPTLLLNPILKQSMPSWQMSSMSRMRNSHRFYLTLTQTQMMKSLEMTQETGSLRLATTQTVNVK